MRIAPCRDPELLDNELCSALDLHPVDAHRLSLLQQHLSPCHPGAAQQGRNGQQLLRMFKVRSFGAAAVTCTLTSTFQSGRDDWLGRRSDSAYVWMGSTHLPRFHTHSHVWLPEAS